MVAEVLCMRRAHGHNKCVDRGYALLNLQMQYTTGMGMGGKTLLSGWRGTLFKEWSWLTAITAGSGLPETPIYLAVVPGTGVTGSIRPEYTGAPLYTAPSG